MKITQQSAENNSSKLGGVPKPRILSLSDLIFGLALSIGAVSLLSAKPANPTALLLSILFFGFSFLILALVWIRYTRIMSVLPVEELSIYAANFVLLFLVSIEPYLYSLINTQPIPGQVDQGVTTTAYAIDLGLMNLIMAYFTQNLTREDRKLIPVHLLRSYRLQRSTSLIVAAVFLGSAIPIFTVYERFLLWGLTFSTYLFATYFVRRRLE